MNMYFPKVIGNIKISEDIKMQNKVQYNNKGKKKLPDFSMGVWVVVVVVVVPCVEVLGLTVVAVWLGVVAIVVVIVCLLVVVARKYGICTS